MGDIKFPLDSLKRSTYPGDAGWITVHDSGSQLGTMYLHRDNRQMGSRNFGDDDPVNMTGTTPPDETEISRGTCGRVSVVA
jgi:hypothetical protein